MLTGPDRAPRSGLAPRHIVIFLHGYGADGSDLISLADEMGEYLPDTYFIAPNAPQTIQPGYGGYQWFPVREIREEALKGDVQQSVPQLNEFVDDQLLKHGLTIDRVAVVGFSQGTMIALHAMLRRDKACAAIVGYSGMLLGGDVLASEIKSKPPVCLIHGTADVVVPFAALAASVKALKAAGVEVESHERPGLPHGIDAEGLKIATDFLKKHLR